MKPVQRRGQWQTAADVLSRVARQPGITRAAVAKELRLSTSTTTEVTARLRDLQLLTETPAPSQGRGRPTTVLRPHPQGPVVLALELQQAGWQSAVVSLDGVLTDRRSRATAAGRTQYWLLFVRLLRTPARSTGIACWLSVWLRRARSGRGISCRRRRWGGALST